MSAEGELYINEYCRDAFTPQLDKAFGKGKWRFAGYKYSDYYDLSEFPLKAEVDIEDADGYSTIGKATITSEATIEEDDFGDRYTGIEPVSIKIRKVKK